MAVALKFKLKQLHDLEADLTASSKAVPLIVRKVLTVKLRELRNSMRGAIPRTSGKLARSFGFSVRTRQGMITAVFGFLFNRKVSAATTIAANVLQKGGATPKKGAYLWIPLPGNRNADGSAQISPRQLLASGFVGVSGAGNKLAFERRGGAVVPMFVLKKSVRLSAPPLPIDARVEAALPEIVAAIPETIRQVIEARKVAVNV